ncbi:MAG: 50S ribosomal protein L10 [Bacillota bacterium]|nr:50S ribosomal protein L10 [Bacillota bacterium]
MLQREAKREAKREVVKELQEKFASSQSVVLADYRGLNVKAMTDLRRRCREAGVEYRVVKNTLARLAARQAGLEGLEELLLGPVSLAFGYRDPVLPAKVLSEFARDHKELEIKGGVLQGKVVSYEAVKALADLPPREVLLARLVGGMQAPLSGLVAVLNGPLRQLVYALEAVRKQKEAGAPAS